MTGEGPLLLQSSTVRISKDLEGHQRIKSLSKPLASCVLTKLKSMTGTFSGTFFFHEQISRRSRISPLSWISWISPYICFIEVWLFLCVFCNLKSWCSGPKISTMFSCSMYILPLCFIMFSFISTFLRCFHSTSVYFTVGIWISPSQDPQKLRRDIDEWMANYDEKQEEKKRLARETQVALEVFLFLCERGFFPDEVWNPRLF